MAEVLLFTGAHKGDEPPPPNVDDLLGLCADIEQEAFEQFGAEDAATAEIVAHVNAIRRIVTPAD